MARSKGTEELGFLEESGFRSGEIGISAGPSYRGRVLIEEMGNY